ncbi:probable E3 ubiquitin-protein ligase ZFP1 [Trifolium pratense]|uniref:probable E3 ubiquitin-protein ligase ZFP1 n=1 Tax=Trifolium pratense TaxID=57577 RepID=UPI001E69305A|nr:probable E3 ubiquitin-protein ligase ZFP1 [Trifolium pratense]
MDQMTDSDMDQQRQGYFHSEPCVLLRGPNVGHPNLRSVVTASGNATNVDSHYLPDAYDNARVYGITQYNGMQPQHNLEMGVAAAGNIYYSGMNPSSSTGVFPLPHRASDQLPGSSTFAISGVSLDNFGRSAGFMDDARGPYKRKVAEGIRGNHQHFNASTSSSIAPPNARHADGVAMMDTAPLPFRVPSLIGVGPHGGAWSRSGESIMVHDHNHLIHGNYLGQHFPPAAPPWLDQQVNANSNDGHTAGWNPSVPMPYIQAPNINGSSLESASMGLQRYHDTAGNRNVLRFPPPPPPVNQQHPNYHHPTLPMQGIRGHNISFHPPVTAASFRVPPNPPRGSVIPPQTGFEAGPRHIIPAPSTGFRIYRPHRLMPEIALGHRSLPPVGFLQVDDVALIDEVGNLIDHHRDMRLDIEDMSYEDLLALGERIGSVNTGLSEETIANQLKTKVYSTKATAINLEEVASDDQETDSCIICQDDFTDQEKIGILRCEHKYHVDCLTKWLLVKNVCPICKSEALAPGRTDA